MVGLVRGIHGLRGAVRLEVLTDDPARFEPGAQLFAEGSDEPLTVDWSQEDGPGILIRFRERPDRAAVEPLARQLPRGARRRPPRDQRAAGTGTRSRAPTSARPPGQDLGTVTDIFRTGGSEVFVVEGPRGEVLIPAVSAIIVEFAPVDGRIVVDGEALALDEAEPRSRLRGRRTTRARRAREQAGASGEADSTGEAAPPASIGREEPSADAAGSPRPDRTLNAAEVDPAAT